MTILELVTGLIAEGATPHAIELAVEAAEAKPATKRSPRKRKPLAAISADAQPNESDRASALAANLYNGHFREEWQKFRDHHLAKGSLMADWSAAWRTWLRNMQRYNPQPHGGSVGESLRKLQCQYELGSSLFPATSGEICAPIGGLLQER